MKTKLFSILFLGLLLLLTAVNFTKCNKANGDSSIVNTTFEPIIEYGIVADSFQLTRGIIKPGQVLGEILYRNHIDHIQIDKIVKASKGIFDVKRAKAGQPFTVFCTKDSNAIAKCFVYEESSTNYVVFDLRDGIKVYRGEKEVEIRMRMASGEITSSLWNAIMDNNMSPALVMELSQIYAWTIDFFRIQKGDKFKVYYEERFVEDEFVGIGRVWAANFTHQGEDFYAFYFNEEGENFGDYFDEEGKTLRKAFLRAPLNFSRISSRYSKRRRHPVTGRVKAHLGTDYAAPKGTPILTTANGTIVAASYTRNNGNYVKIRHNNTYTTQYLHMSKIKSGIRKGVHVKQGDVIGYVGSTGLATGPHVCYRFWKNGVQVDPYKQKLPPSQPMKEKSKASFQLVKDSLIQYLAEPII
ncbi:MAG: peptidoglycan DD-metalloendopeptidase family protein [Flavobacteriales bacterium]|nr:peptidoglycan DD-metalloendopeptidase family protein [Flavobacteriales bacterium]